MINKLVDRAKMVVASATSTTITLGSASPGYQSFDAAGVPDDTDVRYVIEDGTSWEIGSGTYTATGTTVARQDPPDASSNSGSQLASLSANAVIYITPAAADLETLASKVPVRNNTVSDIAAGSLVYSTGSVGGSERIVVDKFTADGTVDELRVVGVVEETLTASGGDGYAVWFGAVKAAAFTSFTAADILYASSSAAGGYVANTPPTAPNQAISVAMVLHQSSGLAFVRIRPGFHIGELHDVISDATQGSNDNEVLAWDSTAGVYQNQTAAEAGLAGLSGATFTGPITVPQGSLGSESIVISGSTTDFGLYNTGAGLVVSDGTNISFIAYSNEIVTYIPVRPSSDNTGTLGTASIRYSNVYSINGTFNSVTINGNNDLASFLSDPTSAKLATAVTDETGSGALVFGTAPTLSQVHDDSTISYNGTDYGIGYRSIPAVSTTGAVTASAAHNGKCITANGTITVPSTLAVGTVISVWVNSASTISIAKSGGTMYLNGTSVTSVTAAAYGIATIYFPSSSTMVVTGNVS